MYNQFIRVDSWLLFRRFLITLRFIRNDSPFLFRVGRGGGSLLRIASSPLVHQKLMSFRAKARNLLIGSQKYKKAIHYIRRQYHIIIRLS
jgi:hypothetical protein